jgi:DNA-binding NtrC family response regulator
LTLVEERDLEAHDLSNLCVLLVEDDEIMRLSLDDWLRRAGIPVRTACEVAGARSQLEESDIDLVVTDVRLPDGTGTELFEEISRRYPGTPVILMTAFGEVSEAVALVKAGAVDYVTKPFEVEALIALVRSTLLRLADAHLSAELTGPDGLRFKPGSGILGKSPAMRRIERLVARLADVDSSILISGESGVGKEVVAMLIHHNSRRASGPLVSVNCAALHPNLVESELFGHEKGAFTGAIQRKIGRFEQAQGGTIFLDEIAEIPTEIQVKLLRVLQEHTLERVGGEKSIPLNVRVLAATQVDLDQAMKEGRFRPDLYWRLNVIHLHIPPLHERTEDILYLSRLFVERQAAEVGKQVSGLSDEAEARLLSMPFPGNVRELKNVLERAVALCDGPLVMEHDLLPIDVDASDGLVARESPHFLKETIENAEREAIRNALVRHKGVVKKAAQDLGISRKNLWEKMRRHGIERRYSIEKRT